MAAHIYPPPEPHTIPPPTNNTLSSKERSALVRSTKKLGRMLGDIPRFVDDIEDQFVMVTPPRLPTLAGPSKEDSWRSRKPTHLPPLMKLSGGIAMDSNSPPLPLRTAPARRTSIISTSSIISSIHDRPPTPSREAAHRRSKMERLRRRLGEEVPMEAVFPATPGLRTAVPQTAKPERSRHHSRSRSVHPSHDDTVTFSIDHHTFVLKTSTRANHPHSPHRSHHPHKSAHRPPPLPMNGLPPLPKPKHSRISDEAGLLGARAKTAAGSKIGGADFKAARRAKREGFGEVEMVGFMGGF
ncbi:hypothetical protein DFH29DRAFT_405070 [Suillus ampliporus]|nr:hypothetical protein DFH29DRAFT_405070 [Suillus ampliporus]